MSAPYSAIDVADEDVMDAARTLGTLRSVGTSSKETPFGSNELNAIYDARLRGQSSETASSVLTPSLSAGPSSTAPSTTSEDLMGSPFLEEGSEFINRVSNMPYIGTAFRVYEQGKNSSRVVKFGAEMMEGTVKTMTRPVIDRLPMSQLDSFANRQLDRFGGPASSSRPSGPSTPDATLSPRTSDAGTPSAPARGRKHLWLDDDTDAAMRRRSTSRESSLSSSLPPTETAYSGSSTARGQFPNDSQWHAIVHGQQDSSRTGDLGLVSSGSPPGPGQEVQVVSRSKWQAVLLEAGGIGAAVSEESMKRLKYCLHWLQYANHHIDQQIGVLRSFIVSISPQNLGSTSSSTAVVPFESLALLQQVKRELVSTIRQVVDVVSKYAGGALPEQARASVRSFILMLPERWSLAARADANESLMMQEGMANGQRGVSGNAAMVASTRVLTLATESLDMMRSVTSVFKESLDRAEAWVDRLQQLGLQRQQQQQRQALPLPEGIPEWRTSPSFETSSHRTTQSSYPEGFESSSQQRRSSRGMTPTDPSSPLSTRAASESGDDAGDATETEMEMDEQMSSMSGDEASPSPTTLKRRRRAAVAAETGMDVDV